ncbi:MAG: hypothetical protein JSU94_21400 [Phycisphaerales bacterium]|nr:MAG: hypothetical protein JSU94_21400 [Phycisphaerales bacterium]
MNSVRSSKLCVALALLILGLSFAWVSAVPTEFNGVRKIGSCCNWDDSKRCPTSSQSGIVTACSYDQCYAGGSGSGKRTSHTYCTGKQYCDEVTGETCSVGHECDL